MILDVVRTIHRDNAWVNARIFETAAPPGPSRCRTSRRSARWERVERDTPAFLTALTWARAVAVVEHVDMEGERGAYPLWQQMLHQVNHATQHRSEIARVLTRQGHSPG
jgi:hypothetical protein